MQGDLALTGAWPGSPRATVRPDSRPGHTPAADNPRDRRDQGLPLVRGWHLAVGPEEGRDVASAAELRDRGGRIEEPHDRRDDRLRDVLDGARPPPRRPVGEGVERDDDENAADTDIEAESAGRRRCRARCDSCSGQPGHRHHRRREATRNTTKRAHRQEMERPADLPVAGQLRDTSETGSSAPATSTARSGSPAGPARRSTPKYASCWRAL